MRHQQFAVANNYAPIELLWKGNRKNNNSRKTHLFDRKLCIWAGVKVFSLLRLTIRGFEVKKLFCLKNLHYPKCQHTSLHFLQNLLNVYRMYVVHVFELKSKTPLFIPWSQLSIWLFEFADLTIEKEHNWSVFIVWHTIT